VDKRYSTLINYFIFFLILIIFLVFQSVLFSKWLNFTPLLFLLIVIYFSNTRTMYFGIIVSFIIGYIYHLHSSSNVILSNFIPVFVFIFSKKISSLFILNKKTTKFLYISFCSLFYYFLLFLWNLYYLKLDLNNIILRGLFNSLILGLIGVFIFNFFEYIDIKTGLKSLDTVEINN